MGVMARLTAAERSRGAVSACFESEQGVGYGALAEKVRRAAGGLASQPDRIALAMEDGLSWMTALLAAAAAGKLIVPVPLFFSPAQIGHLLRDAQVEVVIVDALGAKLLGGFGARLLSLAELDGPPGPDCSREARRVLYTSGITGAPKGVLLHEPQIDAVASRLQAAIGALPSDRHLSLLPLSMLLEQIVAIEVVLGAAASVRFDAAATRALFAGEASAAVELLDRWRPSTTVLVPRQLEALLAVDDGKARFPSSLRFVAVGGAAVAPALATEALRRGLPLCEGYGLTECGSVVAVNRPEDRKSGTVGRPLEGLDVRILDGEVVVMGPSVMQGYLGEHPSPQQVWRTGDLGELDSTGYLRILGRKDDLLVTRQGRNLSPAWIENAIGEADGVVRSLVGLDGCADIVALVECKSWRDRSTLAVLERAARALPTFARPRGWLLRPPGFLYSRGLLSTAGKPLRAKAHRYFAVTAVSYEGEPAG